jgi:3'-phosphoadenosine 5'-phosphosulfate sulfotransferase (PAPS reductase)/FAD synthetase
MEPYKIVETAIERYSPNHVLGLFSGGHDSLCACHIASQHPNFSGVVHINTGIGIEETRQFVRDTCQREGWELLELHPPETYESLVVEHGFPGPAHHYKMYQRLKERCLRQLLRMTRDP